MKIQKIAIQEISFTYCSYDEELKDSIKRIGLSFPIKVSVQETSYQCIDGHKRLSVLQDLLKENEDSLQEVYVIVMNDGSSRSNDCWRGRNTH